MTTRARDRSRRVALFLLLMQVMGLVTEAFGAGRGSALAAEPVTRPLTGGERASMWALPLMVGASGGAVQVAPGAQLTVTPAMAARLRAQLAEAEAILAEAKLRQQQALNGQGGLGARPEDIAAAEAAVGAAKVELRLRQPFDDVRFLQGPILLFDGTTRAATSLRDACGDLEATTKMKLDDKEVDTKLHIEVNCSDEARAALDAAIDVQKSLKTIAELDLKRFTKPSKQVENFLVPYEQAVVQAELHLKKLKSGGLRDAATLELNVARAQADVDALNAALAGSIGGMLTAQLTRAEAELKEALYRIEQAKAGQGGAEVRAEDIGMAEAEVAIAKANLALFLNPIGEDVDKAKAAVDAAEALHRMARKTVEACGKGKVTITLKENDDGEISFVEFIRENLQDRLAELGPRERLRRRAEDLLDDKRPPDFEINLPGLPPIVIDFLRKRFLEQLRIRIEERLAGLGAKIEEINGRITRTRELIAATKETLQDVEVVQEAQCTGEYRRELEALADQAGALEKIADQKLKLLTNPSQQQIAHYVIPLVQAVVVAEARLKKLKTGGLHDLATLERNAARAQADVDGLKAVLGGALPGLYQAQLRGAQAELQEAELRIQQAQAGQGGIGARPEDIAIAEAQLIAANEGLQIIVDPLPELIAAARAGVDAADAGVRAAQQRRKACDRLTSITKVKIENENDNEDIEADEKTFGSASCSEDLKDALEHGIVEARALKTAAELALKKLTDPSEKFVSYFVGPAVQAITIATVRLQKLKTGGLLDQAALELRRSRASAEVDFWRAAAAGSPQGQIEAQLRAAQAELTEAEYRRSQAASGQGGVDARPEDIIIAGALLEIETIRLTQLLNPAPEDISTAEALVKAGLAQVDAARKFRDACDDTTLVSIKKEDRDDDDPRQHRESQLDCPGGRKQAYDAQVDVARAQLEIAEMGFQLLTAPAMPQIENIVIPYQQAVVIATARVQKLKTGGSRDQATLDLNVAVARSDVARFQASLEGSLPGIVKSWIDGALALRDEAQYRVTQAQAGQGGADARAEDIVIAEAEAARAQANFLAIVNPLQETVQSARAALEAAEANIRVAEGQRRACGDLSLIGQEVFDGKTGDRRTVTDADCSDNTKEALNWGVEKARLGRDIAFQQHKLLVNPGMPEILYVIAPFQQAAVAAAANVQKVKTGGGKDQAALDLALTVTQANLDRWLALAEQNPAKLLQAVIGGAQAVQAQALARQQQAQAGAGGPTVRAEDLAIAEANMNARGAELQQLLTPPQEIVQSARIAVNVNAAAAEQARYLKRACGDLELTTTFQEGEDKDGDAKKGRLELKTDIECADDLEDSLRALEEGIEGFKLVPAAILSLLTELDSNEKLQVLVAGKKAAVAIATAELQKLKTGGIFDETALQLNVDVSGSAVHCWQAFAVEASQGGLPQQLRPYAWQDPNPCFLGQLPGKLPPFMKQQVLAPTPGA